MADHLDQSVEELAEDKRGGLAGIAGKLGVTRLRRRTLLKAGLGASIGALLAACGGDDDDATKAPTTAAGEPTATSVLTAPQPTNVPQPTSEVAGTTATAGSATTPSTAAEAPTTTTAAEATGTTGEAFQTIGKLVLRTEPYPKYDGTPADSDQVVAIRAEEMPDLSPTALLSYSPFTFLYDPVLFIDEYSLEVLPWLAPKWEVSADGTTYTLPLRDDIKFHDGTPLTADDVVWSFVAYRDDPDSGVARFFVLMEQDPVAQDEHTVVVTLTSPAGDFLSDTCNQFIMQKAQFNEYWLANNKTLTGFDYGKNLLIGTGQYKLTSFKPDEGVLEMDRNDDYFQGAPHFKKFVFRNVSSAASRLLSWKNKETDMLWPITATDVDQVQDGEGWLYSAYAVAFMNAWINFANPDQPVTDIFKPKEVRQALMHAIDRDGYAEAIFKGFVDQNAYGSIAFPWAYDKDVTHYEYDPAKALEILGTQGWTMDGDTLKNADGQPFKLVSIVANAPQYPVDKIAQSVQEDFRQIGIEMSIEPLEPAALRDRWRTARTFDLYFASRILFAGFSDYNYYHSSFNTATNDQGRNSGWISAEGDKLLDQIIREPDLVKQKALLYSFQELIADDLPALWFGFPRDLILVSKDILGYQPNAMWQYWDMWKMWRTS